MTLSGMSNLEQMQDNLSFMRDFRPLTYREQEIISQVRTLYQAQHRIPCTACRYCVDGCPAGIPIPDVFAAMNAHLQQEEGAAGQYDAFENNASACIGCGQCEAICPQQLHIRSLLQEVEKAFA
jgi:predicted aldo/keto reductase-like oxidoreductase